MKKTFSHKKNSHPSAYSCLAHHFVLIASLITGFTTPSYAFSTEGYFFSAKDFLSFSDGHRHERQGELKTAVGSDAPNFLKSTSVINQEPSKGRTKDDSPSLWERNQVSILTGLVLFLALVTFVLAFALVTLRQKQKIHRLSYAQEALIKALEVKKAALEEMDQLLKEVNTVDELTGLFNVRYFDETLDKELRRASRHQTPLSLLLISFDNYPCYLRHYGHEKTEEQLLFLSDLLNTLCQRASDILAYIQEAKFAIILPHTSRENALSVCHKIHEALREQKVPFIASKTGRLTLSIGLSALEGLNQHINPQHMYNTSEMLRLSAEKAGGNRTRSDCIRLNTEQSLLLDM